MVNGYVKFIVHICDKMRDGPRGKISGLSSIHNAEKLLSYKVASATVAFRPLKHGQAILFMNKTPRLKYSSGATNPIHIPNT